MISPLQKHTVAGKPYVRLPETEAKILELASLSQDELITRCAIRQKDHSDYVPSECLLYFVRASRATRPDGYFEELYKLLIARVLHGLPREERLNGQQIILSASLIRDEVRGQFEELLARDRGEYTEQLDFFEIRFNRSLRTMRLDIQKKAWHQENHSTILDDDKTGEPTAEVERAAGSPDPFDFSDFSGGGYRFALDQAINDLPPFEKQIMKMIRLGFQIDSQDPNIMTISKHLKKSEKTIRTYRNKAIEALRAALTAGEIL